LSCIHRPVSNSRHVELSVQLWPVYIYRQRFTDCPHSAIWVECHWLKKPNVFTVFEIAPDSSPDTGSMRHT